MIGLDTNVLVRYILQDDAAQSARAAALIEALGSESPGFLSQTALVELVWVLTGAYAYSRSEVAAVLDALLRTAALRVDRHDRAWRALRAYAAGKADFADCLIVAGGVAAGCERTVSFDRKAARDAGMALL